LAVEVASVNGRRPLGTARLLGTVRL